MTINEIIKSKKTDIYTYLSEKYETPRALVKNLLFVYAYNAGLNDKYKFKDPQSPYEEMVNDFIDYTLNELKDAKQHL